MSLFAEDILQEAAAVMDLCRRSRLTLATAESCTGGLIAACFSELAGSSDVFERGFVTYSNAAKTEMLGVSGETLAAYGAVSKETALEMAHGALKHSHASITIAVTGVAGPGGGTADKPVGLVHIAVTMAQATALHRECRFGDIGRTAIRLETLQSAIRLASSALLRL
jgi:nicotinamide-nucleotide amidase